MFIRFFSTENQICIFIRFFILCVCVFFLHVCMYSMCVPGACGSQKRVLDSLEHHFVLIICKSLLTELRLTSRIQSVDPCFGGHTPTPDSIMEG